MGCSSLRGRLEFSSGDSSSRERLEPVKTSQSEARGEGELPSSSSAKAKPVKASQSETRGEKELPIELGEGRV